MNIPVQTHIIARNIRPGDIILEVNGHPYPYVTPVSGVTTVATSREVYVRHGIPTAQWRGWTLNRNAHVTVALEPRVREARARSIVTVIKP